MMPLPAPAPTLGPHYPHPSIHLLLGLQQGRAGKAQSGDLASSAQDSTPPLQAIHILRAAPGKTARRARAYESTRESEGPKQTQSLRSSGQKEGPGGALSAWSSGGERGLPDMRPGRVLYPWVLLHRGKGVEAGLGR